MCAPENPTTIEQEEIKPIVNQQATEESSMKHWDMDIIISWGLVVMGIISILGWIIYFIDTGNSNGTEIPMAIVSGLTGALAGRHMPRKEQYPDNNNCNYPTRRE